MYRSLNARRQRLAHPATTPCSGGLLRAARASRRPGRPRAAAKLMFKFIHLGTMCTRELPECTLINVC